MLASIVIALSAGMLGSVWTARAIPTWYKSLNKPIWNPPSRLFAPVWTALYVMMGTAAWLVWSVVGFSGSNLWLVLYSIQLLLNVVWSYIFFGRKNPKLALVEIVALWISILATTVEFWKHSQIAGWLMVPYLLWVTFATYLNLTIWSLNRRT